MVAKKTVLAGQTPQCTQIFREIEEELYNFFSGINQCTFSNGLEVGKASETLRNQGGTPKDRPKL